ncbi:hypothetical protein [Psychrobacter proteolyticus]|uniref:hypothetical protein n=1 Tax=Psychrobacter proteolyticus TaxID=147825 RepID=UPI000E0CBA6E|nr:hypothetical protein [Psychrobacter proteolyticus]
MEIAEILNYLKTITRFSETLLAIIALVFSGIFVLVKIFIYIINRVDTKDDKQFETLYKIIDDANFLERLSNQPFLIKQLFYKRFYILKNYKIEEIEFLMSQKVLKISLHELSVLKSGSIIRFEDGQYIKKVRGLSSYWSNNYHRFNIFIIIFFLIWILIVGFLSLVLFQNQTLFYIAMIPLYILEAYLLFKIDAVRTYLRTKDVIDEFVHQSQLFKDNQGNRNT